MTALCIGVPREIKSDERRVALTPAGASAFRAHGHHVLVQKGAGVGSSIPDALYRDAGAELIDDPADVWNRSDLVLKVKEPVGPELALLRRDLSIFTYLHLAANEELTRALVDSGTTAL